MNAIPLLWTEVEDCVSATGEMEEISALSAMESVIAFRCLYCRVIIWLVSRLVSHIF